MDFKITIAATFFIVCLVAFNTSAQHGPDLVVKGTMFIGNNAIVTVQGDLRIHNDSGYLKNNGHFEIEGNIYKDDSSQYGGSASGKVVLRNDHVNIGETQFIFGEFVGTNAFRQLEIDNQGIIPLVKLASGDIEISNQLILNQGIIKADNVIAPANSGTYQVIISSDKSNAISGNLDDNFIHGKLRRYLHEDQSYVFPVGQLTSDYSGAMPVHASFDDPPLYMDVEVDVEPISMASIQPICDIGNAATGSTSPDGILDQVSLDCVVGGWNIDVPFTDSDNIITFSPPQDLISACNSPFYYILANGNSTSNCPVSNFSAYSLNSSTSFKIVGSSSWANSELPVELTQFTASGFADYIGLSWQTTTEINSEGFELQKGIDGRNFELISWIPGQGQSSDLVNYDFRDEQVVKNTIYYYRLKMVDLDGKYQYSEVKTAILDNSIQFSEARVYPNPVDINSQQLTYTALFSGPVRLELFNTLGKLVFSKSDEVTEGFNNLQLPNLSTGTYYLVIKDHVYTRRATVLISP